MIDGKYYYFNSDGYMERGCVRGGYILKTDGSWNSSYSVDSWHKDNLGWWYGGNTGWYLYNGWNKVDGAWYYFSGNGYIFTNCYIDGFWLGADGVCR